MAVAVLLAGLGLIVAAVAWHAFNVLSERRLLVHRKVVVPLTGGQAMTGVLWARRGRYLVLRGVELVEPGAVPVTVDGEVVLDRDRVEWVQAT